jgi:quinol monooxygenase YgiN
MLKQLFVLLLVTVSLVTVAYSQGGKTEPQTDAGGETKMFGLVGKMTAVEGQRDALINILIEGASNMPGCLSYVVARDPADANAIWITEVWDSQSSHHASLALPAVQQVIARGRPLIAGFGERIITEPVGGHGLTPSKAP